MKYIVGIIIIIASIRSLHAQKVTFNKGGASSENYYAELPYEFHAGYLFVMIEIDGAKRKFLLDTGAPMQITKKLFDELKPDIINHTEITDAAGNKDHLNIVSLKEIKLNGVSFTNIPALVSDSELYACFSIDGVIGSNMFRNSILRIESARGLLIVTDDRSKIAAITTPGSRLSAGEPQSYPYFKIELAGKKTQLVGFDSGSPYFMVMAEAHAKKNIREHSAEKISSGFGISSRSLLGLQKKDSLSRIRLESLTVSGASFKNVSAETNKSDKTRLGNKLLAYGTVTIDYIHKVFYFEPFEEGNDLTEKHWPLKPIVAGQKLIVGVGWPELRGLASSGDQILAIDQESYEAVDLCGWLKGKLAVFNAKKTAVLTIRSPNGDISKVTISKK